jgi:solute carrier family 6 amino acid transporter-like protein 5/7/9/14
MQQNFWISAGVDNLCNDLEFMLSRKVGVYWRLCWGIITPVLMIVILVYAMAIMKPETYHDEPFPSSAYGKNIETTTFNIKN